MKRDLLPPATILVVEHEKLISPLLVAVLRHVGFMVLEATGGAQALEIVRERQPPIDLLLSDLNLPDMNGLELADWVLSECPAPYVILLGGDPAEPIPHGLIQGRPVAVFSRPPDLDELLQLLRILLPPLPPEEEPELATLLRSSQVPTPGAAALVDPVSLGPRGRDGG